MPPPSGDDPLDADLRLLLAQHPVALAAAARVSPLASNQWKRAAVRLDLADGSVLKGRRFESTEAATRYVALASLLPPHSFTRVLMHQGTAVIEEWVEGIPPSTATPGLFHQAGEILRRIHETPVQAGEYGTALRYPNATWQARLTERLDRLVALGALDSVESSRLADMAAANAPEERPLGLVHGDMAIENLVVDRAGRLRAIDSGSLAIHAAAFDFTRSWFRWPMTTQQWTAFEEGYGPSEIPAHWRQHFHHWAIVVLVSVADFKASMQVGDASVPLQQLRYALDEVSRRPPGL